MASETYEQVDDVMDFNITCELERKGAIILAPCAVSSQANHRGVAWPHSRLHRHRTKAEFGRHGEEGTEG